MLTAEFKKIVGSGQGNPFVLRATYCCLCVRRGIGYLFVTRD